MYALSSWFSCPANYFIKSPPKPTTCSFSEAGLKNNPFIQLLIICCFSFELHHSCAQFFSQISSSDLLFYKCVAAVAQIQPDCTCPLQFYSIDLLQTFCY